MSVASASGHDGPQFFLDRERLRALALARRAAYQVARPYPNACFDDFLGAPLATSLARRFPGPDHPRWLRRDYREQSGRMGSIRHLLAELSGMAFLDFLGSLTGAEGLIADPHFRGAGLSITLPGGHLALHADFNRDRTRHLSRKLTVLYYLGEDWDDAWGGALELWNEERTRCEASYAPRLDRLVVMDHGDTFWHGHPAPLACPEDRYRASISAYYYVAAAPDETDAHGAIWADDAILGRST